MQSPLLVSAATHAVMPSDAMFFLSSLHLPRPLCSPPPKTLRCSFGIGSVERTMRTTSGGQRSGPTCLLPVARQQPLPGTDSQHHNHSHNHQHHTYHRELFLFPSSTSSTITCVRVFRSFMVNSYLTIISLFFCLPHISLRLLTRPVARA